MKINSCLACLSPFSSPPLSMAPFLVGAAAPAKEEKGENIFQIVKRGKCVVVVGEHSKQGKKS